MIQPMLVLDLVLVRESGISKGTLEFMANL
jgi:hypothetical protein